MTPQRGTRGRRSARGTCGFACPAAAATGNGWHVTSILETNVAIQGNRMNIITKKVTGWAGNRSGYAATRASRSVSSRISTAIFVRAVAYCRL